MVPDFLVIAMMLVVSQPEDALGERVGMTAAVLFRQMDVRTIAPGMFVNDDSYARQQDRQ